MKKLIFKPFLLLVIILFGCSSGKSATKELTFRDLHFGDSYQDCADKIKEGLKRDGYDANLLKHDSTEGNLPYFILKFDYPDTDIYYTDFQEGNIQVAGYEAGVYFEFIYPDGRTEDVSQAKFIRGYYEISKSSAATDEAVNDLEAKLTELYGTPYYKSSTNDSYLFIWNGFNNQATIELEVIKYSSFSEIFISYKGYSRADMSSGL